MEPGDLSESEILEHLEARLGRRFADPKLAFQALTHSSAKDKDSPCNERLEFLGDSILGHVISEHLFHHFPGYEEGDLSTIKSVIVSAPTLARKAQELGLDRVCIYTTTERKPFPDPLPRGLLAAEKDRMALSTVDAGGASRTPDPQIWKLLAEHFRDQTLGTDRDGLRLQGTKADSGARVRLVFVDSEPDRYGLPAAPPRGSRAASLPPPERRAAEW